MRISQFKVSAVVVAAALVCAGLAAGLVSLGARSAGAQPAAQQSAPQQPAVTQAAPQPDARRHAVIGAITSSADGTLVVTGQDGTAVTVETTSATRIIGRAAGTFASVQAGDGVLIVADRAQDGALTAATVEDVPASLAIPLRGKGGQTQTRNGRTLVRGTVASARSGDLSVTAADGSVTTVAVPQTARIDTLVALTPDRLATGARVMVRGTPNSDGSVTAALIVVMTPAVR